VKDAETALALTTLGCEGIQGEHVSPPLAAQEIVAFAAGLAKLSLR
jgi:EAL domain-containing protein (putative c-di-GMP-specific phosphodiesterase class I)